MDGWIKLHRKLLNSNMYKSLSSKQRDVMIQCLLLANHEENKWEWKGNIYKCNPGQFITSVESLKKICSTDVSVKNIRTTLAKLIKWKFLAIETANTGSLITICNWSIYQSKENENGKQMESKTANRWQTGGKQVATNKNDKNDKNYNKQTDILLSNNSNVRDLFDADEVLLFFNQRFKIIWDRDDFLKLQFRHTLDKIKNHIAAMVDMKKNGKPITRPIGFLKKSLTGNWSLKELDHVHAARG